MNVAYLYNENETLLNRRRNTRDVTHLSVIMQCAVSSVLTKPEFF